jgi:hypothetical protein
MQPSVPVTPALVTISVLSVTTPTTNNTVALHRTTPSTPARIIELVEESIYAVLDTSRDRNSRWWILDISASNHMIGA